MVTKDLTNCSPVYVVYSLCRYHSSLEPSSSEKGNDAKMQKGDGVDIFHFENDFDGQLLVMLVGFTRMHFGSKILQQQHWIDCGRLVPQKCDTELC